MWIRNLTPTCLLLIEILSWPFFLFFLDTVSKLLTWINYNRFSCNVRGKQQTLLKECYYSVYPLNLELPTIHQASITHNSMKAIRMPCIWFIMHEMKRFMHLKQNEKVLSDNEFPFVSHFSKFVSLLIQQNCVCVSASCSWGHCVFLSFFLSTHPVASHKNILPNNNNKQTLCHDYGILYEMQIRNVSNYRRC